MDFDYFDFWAIFENTLFLKILQNVYKFKLPSALIPLLVYWRKSKLPHATIFKPQQPYRRCVADTFKDFPAQALELMETLLSIDPADRGSAASALHSEAHVLLHIIYSSNQNQPPYRKHRETDHSVFMRSITDLQSHITESCKMVSALYGPFKSKATEQLGAPFIPGSRLHKSLQAKKKMFQAKREYDGVFFICSCSFTFPSL
ncbi:uncharacterized protein LOC114263877 [Camellia sinensis]|uniref:uncharacterized protein LOC114263877 n=1 Tax=Camellia sinensis TaxID=4442 RepID=UPI0010363476|nr:uncharacterized protein LOC114263877 [Camellia sinensis]